MKSRLSAAPETEPSQGEGTHSSRAGPCVLGVGEQVGRYVLGGLLGAGGMGMVYEAYDPELDRPIALKLVAFGAPPRRLAEARAAASLQHPNVIDVLDVGVTANGVFFIAMELVEGGTMRDAVVGRTPLEIVALYCAAGEGLAAAHEAGLVHRDFKPANVVVGHDGRPRVMDFGLVQALGDSRVLGSIDDEASTRRGHPRGGSGTPAYMAPEQVLGAVDARADQFSFCVALYEALFGCLPFEGGSAMMYAVAASSGVVRRPPGIGIPTRIVEAIVRGLRAEPDARWPTMRALLDELRPPQRGSWKAARLLAVAGAAVVALAAVELHSRPAEVVRAVESPAAPRYVTDEKLLAGLEEAQAHADLGLYANAQGKAEALVVQARAAGDGPLLARALHLLGSLEGLRDLPDAQREHLEEAYFTAAQAEAHETAARAAIELIAVDSIAGGQPEVWRRCAESHIQEAADPELEATLLISMGWAHREHGRLDDARAAYERALAVRERIHGPQHRAVARTMGGLAAVLSKSGRHAEALALFDKALAVTAGERGAGHLLGARLLNGRGIALRNLERYEASIGSLEAAVELQTRILGPDNTDTARARHNLANSLVEVGRLDEAQAEYEAVLSSYRATYGVSHPRVASVLANYAALVDRQGDAARALQIRLQALAILQEELGSDHPGVAMLLLAAAGSRSEMGDHDRAAANLNEARRVLEAKLPGDHVIHLDLQIRGCQLAHARGDLDTAASHAETALARRATWPGHVEYWARLHACLSRVEWERGDRARARELARSAWHLFAEDRSAHDLEVAKLEQWMRQTGTKPGRR